MGFQMNDKEHISIFSRIKNLYSNHRDFFRILQCLVLALLFVVALAYSVHFDVFHDNKDEREVDNIYISWEIPEGKIIKKSSRELLVVPVSLQVSTHKKNFLYKLDEDCFKIQKNIPDDKDSTISIMPEDVEITKEEYKPYVKIEKVIVKDKKFKLATDKTERGVIFPIFLDKNSEKKLRVCVRHDNNVPEYCWVDEDKITTDPKIITVTGPNELLNKYYPDGKIYTEIVYLDNSVQSFKTENIQLLVRKNLKYSQTQVNVSIPIEEYLRREIDNLPISAMLSDPKKGEKLKWNSDGLTSQNDKLIDGGVRVILRGKKEDMKKLESVDELQKNVCLFVQLDKAKTDLSSPELFCTVSISIPGVTVLGILPKKLSDTFQINYKIEEAPPEQKTTTDNNPEMENSKNDSQDQSVQSGNTQGNAWWKWNRSH